MSANLKKDKAGGEHPAILFLEIDKDALYRSKDLIG